MPSLATRRGGQALSLRPAPCLLTTASVPHGDSSTRGEGGEEDRGPPEPEARGPGPEEQASGHEDAARVHRALATLDEEFREAVVLRDLEGLSYEEIAEATGVPAGTVRSRIHRGRAILRERLLPAADRAGGAR